MTNYSDCNLEQKQEIIEKIRKIIRRSVAIFKDMAQLEIDYFPKRISDADEKYIVYKLQNEFAKLDKVATLLEEGTLFNTIQW